jgi:hypothetical protein
MSGLITSPEFLFPLLLVGTFCAAVSISRWVRGFQLLVVMLLFGGIAGARIGITWFPIAFRDALIVLPLYTAFLFSGAAADSLARVPVDLALALSALLAWLMISLFNPEGLSGLQLFIGLKVWLFYIPFFLIGIALAVRPHALFKVFRALLVFGLVACAAGLLQAALIRLIGYQAAISLFFGPAAASVTQGFSAFYVGGNIYRIPGTFSFGSQYVGFLFLFITVAVIEANTDSDPRFRRIGRVAFYVGILAGLFSGTKGAFLMFPLFAAAFSMLGMIRAQLLIAAPLAIGVGVWAISAAGLDPFGLASYGAEQVQRYGEGFVFQQIADATSHGVFGEGIGSSTGAARFALLGSPAVSRLGFESYFAKTAAELGAVGLVIIVGLIVVIAMRATLSTIRHYGRVSNRIIAPFALYILYVLVTSLKGYPLDVDPANIFFWLAIGIIVGMDRVREPAPTARPAHAQPELAKSVGASSVISGS